MHVNVLFRENFSNKKIKLLQLTAGSGSLRQAPPYKTGYRFVVLDKIDELGFVFKSNLSNKQRIVPKLPNGMLKDTNDANADAAKDADDDNDADDAKDADNDDADNAKDSGDDDADDAKDSGEYELHGGGVSSCAQSSSRTRQQTNFFAEYGKNVNSDSSEESDSNDGEEYNLDDATGDSSEESDSNDGEEYNLDDTTGDSSDVDGKVDDDAMDDDNDIIDLTVESEGEKVAKVRRVSNWKNCVSRLQCVMDDDKGLGLPYPANDHRGCRQRRLQRRR